MSQLGLPMHDERPARDPRRPSRPGRRRAHGRLAVAGALVVVAALVVGGFLGVRSLVSGLGPGTEVSDFAGPGAGAVPITVEPGDSLGAIGQRLTDAGVVASADLFVAAAQANPEGTSIQPGQYQLQQRMPAADALGVLLDPSARQAELVLLKEGRTLRETLETLAKGTGLPLAQLQAVAAEPPASLGLPAWSRGRLEGFVFPASYEFPRGATASAVLAATVERFDQAAAQVGLVEGAARLGYSPYEVLTVASLVEAEAPAEARAEVARVIYNRLAEGMPLQLDATVNYATGKTVVNATEADKRIASPYNTYRVEGLPPGPIANPGEAAMRAALEPAAGDWLYYVTVDLDTGETKFARTYEEHQRNVAQLREWLAANPR